MNNDLCRFDPAQYTTALHQTEGGIEFNTSPERCWYGLPIMLHWVTGLRLLVHHDDAEREYAYDGGSEKALQLAAHEDWLTVSMKNDWKIVF